MEKVTIEFAKDNDFKQIEKLSKTFEEEKCCNGIVADNEEFFRSKNVAVARHNNNVIGYCYGKVEVKEKNTSFYKKGQKTFYIEEIYIDKNFRNLGVGQQLFDFIENYAKENACEFIETTAVSKDYEKLLSFYIKKLDMNFWSASLIKKI